MRRHWLIGCLTVLLLVTGSVRADEDHPVQPSSAGSVPAALPAEAREGSALHWESVTLPPVGEITDIAIDPSDPNWLWLVTDAGGALVSSDGGTTWRKAQTRNQDYLLHGKFVAVSPADGRTVVTDSDQGGKFSGLAYSRDQGETWRGVALGEVRGPGDVYAAAFDSTDADRVYAVKGQDMFRIDLSTERVTNLGQSISGAVFRTIVVDPRNSQRLYSAGQADSGGLGGMLSLGRSDRFGPFESKTKLYRSLDGGESWTELAASIGSIGRIVFDPMATDTLYAGTTSGVFRSADGGATWTELTDPGWPSLGVESVALSGDGSVLLAGTRQGAWTSRDGGINWTSLPLPDDRPRERFVDSVAIDPTDSARLWLGTTDGLFRSTDGGQTVTKLSGLYNYDVLLLAVDPYDPRRLFTGTSCARGIHRTDDQGQTWRWGGGNDFTREFLTGLDNHYQMDIDIALTNPNIVWNTTAQGVYKSIDGGLTWEIIDHELTRVPMNEPAHLPWWHFHGLGIHPTDPNRVIIGNGTGGLANVPGPSETFVLRTDDGGQSWEKVVLSRETLSSIQDVVFDPFDPNTIYVPTHTEPWGEVFGATQQVAQGLFRSTDGGKTFERFDHDLASLEMAAFSVSRQTSGLLFAMGHSELGHGSGDGHESGEATNAVLSISRTGGEHWETLELPIDAGAVSAHNGFVVDPTDDQHWLVATNQGLLITRDAGATWSLERHGLPEAFGQPTFLTIDPSGSLVYLVTNLETGPNIFQATLRPVVVSQPPVERIEKSETEQFASADQFRLPTNMSLRSSPLVRIVVGAVIGVVVALGVIIGVVAWHGRRRRATAKRP